jgi:hypothetical protein
MSSTLIVPSLLASQDAYVTVIVKVFVAVALALSVIRKIIEVGLPAAVGVPEITPLELRDNPVGRVPDIIVHVYGVVPPLAVRVCE